MDDKHKVMELMQLMQLNEYVKENLGMELLSNYATTVKQEIDNWEQAIEDGEVPQECVEDNKKTIEELRKYMEYSCIYALSLNGDFFEQGFVICDDKFSYIGFVKTI